MKVYNIAGRKLIGRLKEEEVVMNLKIASRYGMGIAFGRMPISFVGL